MCDIYFYLRQFIFDTFLFLLSLFLLIQSFGNVRASINLSVVLVVLLQQKQIYIYGKTQPSSSNTSSNSPDNPRSSLPHLTARMATPKPGSSVGLPNMATTSAPNRNNHTGTSGAGVGADLPSSGDDAYYSTGFPDLESIFRGVSKIGVCRGDVFNEILNSIRFSSYYSSVRRDYGVNSLSELFDKVKRNLGYGSEFLVNLQMWCMDLQNEHGFDTTLIVAMIVLHCMKTPERKFVCRQLLLHFCYFYGPSLVFSADVLSSEYSLNDFYSAAGFAGLSGVQFTSLDPRGSLDPLLGSNSFYNG